MARADPPDGRLGTRPCRRPIACGRQGFTFRLFSILEKCGARTAVDLRVCSSPHRGLPDEGAGAVVASRGHGRDGLVGLRRFSALCFGAALRGFSARAWGPSCGPPPVAWTSASEPRGGPMLAQPFEAPGAESVLPAAGTGAGLEYHEDTECEANMCLESLYRHYCLMPRTPLKAPAGLVGRRPRCGRISKELQQRIASKVRAPSISRTQELFSMSTVRFHKSLGRAADELIDVQPARHSRSLSRQKRCRI